MKLPSDIKNERPKPAKSRIRLLLKVAAVLAGLLLLYWFARSSDFDEIIFQLVQINVRFLYLLAVTFAAFLIVSYAWKLSFFESNDLSVPRLFILRLIGESLAQVNPANILAGDALKAVLLKAKGISYKSGIVSLTVARFMIIISNITLIIIGIILYFDILNIISGKIGLVVILALFLSFPVATHYLLQSGKGLFSFPVKGIRIFEKIINKDNRFEKTIKNLSEMDAELIEFYRTKKPQFFMIFVLSLMHWIIGMTEYYIIFTLLGIDTPFFSCIALGVGVVVVKAVCSFIPGQIGVEEYGHKVMLDLLNISGTDLWLTISILRRARQIFWLCAGMIAFLCIMKTKSQCKEINNGSVVYNS